MHCHSYDIGNRYPIFEIFREKENGIYRKTCFATRTF